MKQFLLVFGFVFAAIISAGIAVSDLTPAPAPTPSATPTPLEVPVVWT